MQVRTLDTYTISYISFLQFMVILAVSAMHADMPFISGVATLLQHTGEVRVLEHTGEVAFLTY